MALLASWRRRRTLVDLVSQNLANSPDDGEDWTEVFSVAILRDEFERAEAVLASVDRATAPVVA